MSEYSLSDLAAVTHNNDNDNGWGGGAWWIILLFLFWGFNGNGWNRQGEYGQYATAASQQEILYGQQFGQLNDRLTNIGNGICNLGYEMQRNVTAEGRNLSEQLAQCCCDNRLATANLGAQIDRQTCDITTAIHAEGEATRALIQTNEIQSLRDKVNSLEMDSRFCGVVRYPMSYTYNAGPSPFCGCNNGCGCNNI
nr:MAG TPA: hypothetical protein [Caudoviricetes sp.]